jgi:hypothetical protein
MSPNEWRSDEDFVVEIQYAIQVSDKERKYGSLNLIICEISEYSKGVCLDWI